MTTGRTLPRWFEFLASQRNSAVDAALVESLPHFDAATQRLSFDLLLRRGHPSSLERMVAAYDTVGEPLQSMLVSRIDDLLPAARAVLSSRDAGARESVVRMLNRSSAPRLAATLADALTIRCPVTRDLAGKGLKAIAETHHAALERSGNPGENEAATHLVVEALNNAIQSWEGHMSQPVLEAALLYWSTLDSTMVRLLARPTSRFCRAVVSLLDRSDDPRLGGFLLRGLGLSSLRATAALVLQRMINPDRVRAVADAIWLLCDPEVAEGCRKITQLSLFGARAEIVTRLEAPTVVAVLELVHASGVPADQRIGMYRSMIDDERPMVRRAAFWKLIDDHRPQSTEVLRQLALRTEDELAVIARRELASRGQVRSFPAESVPYPVGSVSERKTAATAPDVLNARRSRQGGSAEVDSVDQPVVMNRGSGPAPIAAPPDPGGHLPRGTSERPPDVDRLRSDWERYWMGLVNGAMPGRSDLCATLRNHPKLVAPCLRAKLAGSDVHERWLALYAVEELRCLVSIGEPIYALAHDPDPNVRSRAVTVLGRIRDLSAQRILAAALSDPEPRVQANAIEALDRHSDPKHRELILGKLRSDHPRVRANAIKSLLRFEMTEAGVALLDMLEHPQPEHRISALWIVGHMKLRSLGPRIQNMNRNDPDERVRRRAGRILGVLESAAARSGASRRPVTGQRAEPIAGLTFPDGEKN